MVVTLISFVFCLFDYLRFYLCFDITNGYRRKNNEREREKEREREREMKL